MGELAIEGTMRWIFSMLVADVVSVAFGGEKSPSLRNVFALLMRRSDDAEGESRMMGSNRLAGRFCRLETRAAWGAGPEGASEGRLRRKVAAMVR